MTGIGIAAAGDGVGLSSRARQAGCAACAASGWITGARLTGCVRLAYGCGALGSAVAVGRTDVAEGSTHNLAKVAGWAWDAIDGVLPAQLIVVLRARATWNATFTGRGLVDR
eukprot:4421140-Prymnesium_polylepis.1